MRMPQVSERIKEAPAQALRGVFAGIGQLLLITDKLRNKTPMHADVAHAPAQAEPTADAPAADAPAPAPAPAAEAAAPAAAAPEETVVAGGTAERDFDKTGNVQLIAKEAAKPAAAEAPAAEAVAPEAVAPEAVAAEAPAAAAVAAAPLPNYDELTVASLRARLRNLSIEQVRELAEYERAHAARPEVIAMFERRVAKMEAGA
jgi:hypothetical protein